MTRSILITGCSSGIGRDAALTLHGRGWRVFATCRKEEDCEGLRAAGLESFRLDYADPESVAAAVAEAEGRAGGALTAVFNNGAFAQPGAMEDLPRAALEASFQTNLFGPFDVIRRVLPGMLAAGRGRIVNCSSVLGLVALRYRGAYAGTKFAMEAMTDALRMENRGTGVHVILIEPGPIDTPIRRNSVPHFERWVDWQHSAKRAEYEALVRPRLYAKHSTDGRQWPVARVTEKLIHALEHPRPRPRYYVTPPTWGTALMRRLLPTRLLDRLLMMT